MFSENTQLHHSQINGNIYASLDGYNTIARRNVEMQNIHAHVHEYNAITPKNSIKANQEAQVHVRWSMYGDMTSYITGTWSVSAFLELQQPCNTQRIPLATGATIALTPQTEPVDYETWVKVPADTVTFDEDEYTKLYKLVVVVSYNAPTFSAVPLTSGVGTLTSQSHFKLVAPLTYGVPTGLPGPQTDIVDGPELQFYIVV